MESAGLGVLDKSVMDPSVKEDDGVDGRVERREDNSSTKWSRVIWDSGP
jgi:hypothetical protein